MDATVNWNLSVSGTDNIITATRIQAPPFSISELAGTVNVGRYLNSSGGASLGTTDIIGALVVGATNVMNVISNVCPTLGPTRSTRTA